MPVGGAWDLAINSQRRLIFLRPPDVCRQYVLPLCYFLVTAADCTLSDGRETSRQKYVTALVTGFGPRLNSYSWLRHFALPTSKFYSCSKSAPLTCCGLEMEQRIRNLIVLPWVPMIQLVPHRKSRSPMSKFWAEP